MEREVWLGGSLPKTNTNDEGATIYCRNSQEQRTDTEGEYRQRYTQRGGGRHPSQAMGPDNTVL